MIEPMVIPFKSMVQSMISPHTYVALPASAIRYFEPDTGQAVSGADILWTDTINSDVALCKNSTIDVGQIKLSGSAGSGIVLDSITGWGWPAGSLLTIGYVHGNDANGHILSDPTEVNTLRFKDTGTSNNLSTGNMPADICYIDGVAIIEDPGYLRSDFYNDIVPGSVMTFTSAVQDANKGVGLGLTGLCWKAHIYAMVAYTNADDRIAAEALILSLKP